ncbi:hypothetical protein KC19_5G106400 [Ceratodon purpureus]|uniref:Uncharacterized protein n=1 Tax=Ceratodon purpureus TaxID=3225 RepID=A0A8T0I012_CERPU|nr:hypothetical protein KC19_5G106400 [Ceratodon purpureus]
MTGLGMHPQCVELCFICLCFEPCVSIPELGCWISRTPRLSSPPSPAPSPSQTSSPPCQGCGPRPGLSFEVRRSISRLVFLLLCLLNPL